MNYYINGRFLAQQITGVQRYAREMVLAIDKILPRFNGVDKCEILIPGYSSTNLLQLKNITYRRCGYLSGHLWEQFELPLYSRDGFLINLCNCAPLIKKNQMVTIHDAAVEAYPQAYSFTFRTWYRIMHIILGKRLDLIATVSRFSSNELIRCLKVNRGKVLVTYNGTEHLKDIATDDSILSRLRITCRKYVLAVSSSNMTKNFQLVRKLANMMPNVLFVIAGGKNTKVFCSNEIGDSNNLLFAGYVTDNELVSLYRHATIFVYPSLYEGFGIPPLEAMMNQCPVIASSAASIPEICGDAALYCSPYDSYEWIEQIGMLMENDQHRVDLIKRGNEQVKKYNWYNEATKFMAFIVGESTL